MIKTKNKKQGRKHLITMAVPLLLSACFVACQFNPMLEIDKSSSALDDSQQKTNSETLPEGNPLLNPTVHPTLEFSTTEEPLENERYYSALTGMETTPALAVARPLAICVGNTAKSLPQYGLSFADILVEAPVEGGSTRLMAIVENYRAVSCFGSVRSTRDYLQVLSSSFDAISAFAGKTDTSEKPTYHSGDSLDYIAQNLTNTFYRDTGRAAPHNLMTSGDLLSFSIDDCGYRTTSTQPSLPYRISINQSASVTAREQSAQIVDLPFSSLQKSRFIYDPAKNLYYRYQNGAAHIDALTNAQLSYSNLIVIFCDSVVNTNASGESILTMSLSGQGTGYFMSGGSATEISWRRSSDGTSLLFLDRSGRTLTVPAGRSYIALMKKSTIESIVIE